MARQPNLNNFGFLEGDLNMNNQLIDFNNVAGVQAGLDQGMGADYILRQIQRSGRGPIRPEIARLLGQMPQGPQLPPNYNQLANVQRGPVVPLGFYPQRPAAQPGMFENAQNFLLNLITGPVGQMAGMYAINNLQERAQDYFNTNQDVLSYMGRNLYKKIYGYETDYDPEFEALAKKLKYGLPVRKVKNYEEYIQRIQKLYSNPFRQPPQPQQQLPQSQRQPPQPQRQPPQQLPQPQRRQPQQRLPQRQRNRREKIFGPDKPDPNQDKSWWDTILNPFEKFRNQYFRGINQDEISQKMIGEFENDGIFDLMRNNPQSVNDPLIKYNVITDALKKIFFKHKGNLLPIPEQIQLIDNFMNDFEQLTNVRFPDPQTQENVKTEISPPLKYMLRKKKSHRAKNNPIPVSHFTYGKEKDFLYQQRFHGSIIGVFTNLVEIKVLPNPTSRDIEWLRTYINNENGQLFYKSRKISVMNFEQYLEPSKTTTYILKIKNKVGSGFYSLPYTDEHFHLKNLA